MPQLTSEGREYLTTIEAEQVSGLRRNYLTLLLRKGKLEGFRPARDWFIYKDSLERFLANPRKPGPRQGSHRKNGKQESAPDSNQNKATNHS
jgi:hypothetical protein